MIIDGHAHACGSYLTSDTINHHLDRVGADMVVLTPGEMNSSKTYSLPDRTKRQSWKDPVYSINRISGLVIRLTGARRGIRDGNLYVSNLKLENPRVKQFYWLSSEDPSELDGIYTKRPFEGLKIHQLWFPLSADSRRFDTVCRWLEERDLPLFIHLSTAIEIRKMIRYTQQRAKLRIIVAHLHGFEEFDDSGALGNERLFFDLSNAYFVSAERMKKAVNKLGASRFLLGSDTPYGRDALMKTIERIDSLPLSTGEKELILGENMRELLKLQD